MSGAQMAKAVSALRTAVRRVTWTDTWSLTGPDGVATPISLDELLEAVIVALYGPNIEHADFPG